MYNWQWKENSNPTYPPFKISAKRTQSSTWPLHMYAGGEPGVRTKYLKTTGKPFCFFWLLFTHTSCV